MVFLIHPEFSYDHQLDAARIDGKELVNALNLHLQTSLASTNRRVIATDRFCSLCRLKPSGLKREDLENAVAQFVLKYPGIADAYTRTQLENGNAKQLHCEAHATWLEPSVSGDVMIVLKPYWYFLAVTIMVFHMARLIVTTTNVPLMIMGKPWIKPKSMVTMQRWLILRWTFGAPITQSTLTSRDRRSSFSGNTKIRTSRFTMRN